MKPSHIYAIIRKQLKDTFRNKPTLVQFVMFPAIAAILTLSAGEFELTKRYFVNLFSVMYVCMAPILILSAIISEEKEKGSLRMRLYFVWQVCCLWDYWGNSPCRSCGCFCC